MTAEQQAKTCTKCNEAKRMCDFYKGRAKCKTCISEESKDRYLSDQDLRERKKANSATRYQRIKGSDFLKRQSARASARYRERHHGRLAANYERDKERIAERLRKWRKKNNKKVHAQSVRRRPKQLVYYKEQADKISDLYVARLLHLPVAQAPTELINLKRAQLITYRLTKQLKQEIKNVK